MLPPLCYAIFGIVTPLIAKRFDLEPTLVVALAALTVGLLGRGLAGDALWLVSRARSRSRRSASATCCCLRS
jgi:CP family cyanate transporter-like MFS transporter